MDVFEIIRDSNGTDTYDGLSQQAAEKHADVAGSLAVIAAVSAGLCFMVGNAMVDHSTDRSDAPASYNPWEYATTTEYVSDPVMKDFGNFIKNSSIALWIIGSGTIGYAKLREEQAKKIDRSTNVRLDVENGTVSTSVKLDGLDAPKAHSFSPAELFGTVGRSTKEQHCVSGAAVAPYYMEAPESNIPVVSAAELADHMAAYQESKRGQS